MKTLLLLPALLILTGCGSTNLISVNQVSLSFLTPEELKATEFYCSASIEFVSLKKGEVVGEDIFKVEKKKTFVIQNDTPGHLVASGPNWLNVEFLQGIVLTFTWDSAEQAYFTPGWGTTTIAGERFDLRQGVLSGRMVKLMMPPLN